MTCSSGAEAQSHHYLGRCRDTLRLAASCNLLSASSATNSPATSNKRALNHLENASPMRQPSRKTPRFARPAHPASAVGGRGSIPVQLPGVQCPFVRVGAIRFLSPP